MIDARATIVKQLQTELEVENYKINLPHELKFRVGGLGKVFRWYVTL